MHLFDGVHYYLSSSLSATRHLELSHVLDNNGAVPAQSIDDSTLTHVLTNSNRFERWQDVTVREEAGEVAVVTDKWADRSMMHGKLQPTAYYSADPAMIFSGVVACATGLPTPDLEVLSAGISALGGQWRTALTKDVTHLFAITPSSLKYSTALHFQEHTQVKVLLPHWFDDAVRLGMGGLETTPYEWPDPFLLTGPGGTAANAGDKDKDKDKNTGKEADAAKKLTRRVDAGKKSLYRTASLWTPDTPLPAPAPTSSFSSSSPVDFPVVKNVWHGRKVLLSLSLELSGGRREAVEVGITRAGGVIVRYDGEEEGNKALELGKVEDCDVFVTRFRSGKAYVKAVRHSKTIGTLPWVFHVQYTGILSPPMDQLLYYPIPNKPIEGFAGHEITVTNYTGESREYLKKLIMAMGATFTPSMSGRNTVLIAAYISGTKTTKAASWSIPIVNHTWLEDCFVKWRNLTVGLEKYIVFPPGVDFAAMLGERGVGRAVEEITEEELEALENEEDAEKGNEEAGEEVGMGNALLRALAGTENSAKDAKEVEDAVEIGGDGGVTMGVEGGPKGGVDELAEANGMDIDGSEHGGDEKEGLGKEMPRSKTIASRIRETSSPAKTRVKPTAKSVEKGKKKAGPSGLESDDEVVIRVNRRKSGRIEMVSPSKAGKGGKGKGEESEASGETSSGDEDDEIEVVEVISRPGSAKRLVRRVGEGHDSWIGAQDEPEKQEEEEQEEDGGDGDNSGHDRVEEEEKARTKAKAKAKKTISDDEMDVDKPRVVQKKRNIGKMIISDDDEESVGGAEAHGREIKVTRPVAGAGVKTSTSTIKTKGKAKARSDDEGRDASDVEAVVQKKTREKFRGAEKKVEAEREKEMPKRRPVQYKAKLPKPATEPEDESSSASEDDIVPTSSKKSQKASPSSAKAKAKSKFTAAQSSPPTIKTPKKVMSVVMPPLTSTKNASPHKAKGTPSSPARLARTGSMRLAAEERGQVSAGRPSASAVSAPGPKTKQVVDPSPPSSVVAGGRASSKRSAATRASQKLHDEIMPDVMNYQSEMRNKKSGRKSLGLGDGLRSGSMVVGGSKKKRMSDARSEPESERGGEERDKKRRRISGVGSRKGKKVAEDGSDIDAESVQPAKGKSKKSMENEEEEESEASDAPHPAKTTYAKAKKAGKAGDANSSVNLKKGNTVRLMTTQVTLSEDVLKALTKLGVKMTTRAAECTHLLAPHLVRTEKFLCALAVAPFILTGKWAVDSAAAKKLLPEGDYLLRDKVNERKYDFVLADALVRAKELGGQLFGRKTFYVTPRVPIDLKLLRNVVTACGGQISTQLPTLRMISSSADRHVISCPEDVSIWRPIAQQYPIYTQELLLTGALKQEIDWDSKVFRVSGSS